MPKRVLPAFAATLLVTVSLYLWQLAYVWTDWAALALLPLATVIGTGIWPLVRDPWRARLLIMLRPDSILGRWLTGWLRATVITVVFTFVTVTLLAWQALILDAVGAVLFLSAFLLSACLFASGQNWLLRHFYQPFARSFATTAVTWLVALPFTLILAFATWSSAMMPGAILQADLPGAVQIGLQNLPERGGWIAYLLAIPYGYEAAKIWAVVQLRDYWIFGVLFSIDAALYSFVLCRSAIVITQFIETYVMKADH